MMTIFRVELDWEDLMQDKDNPFFDFKSYAGAMSFVKTIIENGYSAIIKITKEGE